MTQGRQLDRGFDQLPGEVVDWLMKPFASFLRIEAAAGAILLAVTIAALVLSNSPWATSFSASGSCPSASGSARWRPSARCGIGSTTP
jgi:hypothetical protein